MKTKLKISLRKEKHGDLIVYLILRRKRRPQSRKDPACHDQQQEENFREAGSLKSEALVKSLIDKVQNNKRQGHFTAGLPG